MDERARNRPGKGSNVCYLQSYDILARQAASISVPCRAPSTLMITGDSRSRLVTGYHQKSWKYTESSLGWWNMHQNTVRSRRGYIARGLGGETLIREWIYATPRPQIQMAKPNNDIVSQLYHRNIKRMVQHVGCLVKAFVLHIVPVRPPLTDIHCAVIHRLFSDTSKSTASATSSVVPRRASARVIGIRAVCIGLGDPSGFLRNGFDDSVGTGPGATVLTVIPRLFPSCKNDC